MRKQPLLFCAFCVLVTLVSNAVINVNLLSPENNTFLGYNTSIEFLFNVTGNHTFYNCSIYTNRTGSWVANITNMSVINNTNSNFTLYNFPDAGYIWNINCTNETEENWSIGNFTLTFDTIYPNWSNNLTSPISNWTYNRSTVYWFNVTWSDIHLTQVFIQHNFTGSMQSYDLYNITDIFFYNYTNISAGSYIWNMWANDSAGNSNYTYNFSFIIAKAIPVINLTINGSYANFSINESQYVNITGYITDGDNISILIYDGSAFINNGTGLLHNETIFDTPGNYTITLIYNESQNYSYSNISYVVQVNDTPPYIAGIVNISLNASTYKILWNTTEETNSTIYYGLSSNSYTLSTSNNSFLQQHNVTLNNLEINTTYYYRINNTDQEGNINISSEYNFTTEFADLYAPNWTGTSTFPATGTIFNTSTKYQFNMTWMDNTNITGVWIEHNFSGSLANNSVTGNVSGIFVYNYTNISAGAFVWRMWANDSGGNLNYSDFFTYVVNKASSLVNLSFNGTDSNISINQTWYVTINASKLIGDLNISLYLNGTLLNNSNNGLVSNIVQINDTGAYNITVVYPESQNYTFSNKTLWVSVNDSIYPEIFVISPMNHSRLSSLVINISTSEICSCRYKLNDDSFSSLDTSNYFNHSKNISANEGAYNITINCTDPANFSSNITLVNITFDFTAPILNISSPVDSEIIYALTFDLNYSFNDSNIDSVWYNINNNNTNIALNSSDPGIMRNQSISVLYPGKQLIIMFVNDTAGNINYDSVTFYINASINISEWLLAFNESLGDLNTAEAFNITGENMTEYVSIYQDFTLELNFTSLTLQVINFSGNDAVWNYKFQAFDQSTDFENDIISNYGTNATDYIYVTNFSNFYSSNTTYFAKIKLPNNSSSYDNLYFCEDDGLDQCNAFISTCNSYSKTQTAPCYNTTESNTYIYVPHLSAVFGDNDTIAPVINITSPENHSIVNGSYTQFSFTINEQATCWYQLDSGTITLLGTSSSFSPYINISTNAEHNVTAYCNDSNHNSRDSKINITLNDTSISLFSVSESKTTTTATLGWATDEPTNYSATFTGESASSSSTYILSHSLDYTGLTADTRYYYNVTACDRVGNCRSVSGSVTTRAEEDEPSDEGSSSGGPSGDTGAAKKVVSSWNQLSAGEHLMFVSSTSIAMTQIIFNIINKIENSATIMVETISILPDNINPLHTKVFQYIRITKTGMTDENISIVNIKFRVDKSWISNNNIEPASIELYRFAETWDKLSTTLTTSDSTYYYYESESPGLSYFCIRGDEKAITNAPPTTTTTLAEPPVTGQVLLNQTEKNGDNQIKNIIGDIKAVNLILPISLVLVLSLVVLFLVYQHKFSVVTDPDLVELREYVQKCKEEGIPFDKIKNTLTKVGWKESVVDLVIHDVHLPHDDMEKLVTYVRYCIKKGTSKKQIMENLLRIGWQPEIVTEAFSYTE